MLNSLQYEYVNEESIDNEFICTICQKPLDDPRCTPCDHIFCGNCITEWIQRKIHTCPTCRQPLRHQELTQANRIVRSIVGKFRVKCMACVKIDLERSDFERHMSTACPIVCLETDITCPWTGMREAFNNHVTNCSYQNLRKIFASLLAERQQLKEKASKEKVDIEKFKDEIQQLKNELKQNQIRNQNSNRNLEELEKRQKCQIDEHRNKLLKFEEQTRKLESQFDRYKKEGETLKEQQRAAVGSSQKYAMQLNNQLTQQCIENNKYQREVEHLKKQMRAQSTQNAYEIWQLKNNAIHYNADSIEYQDIILQLKQQVEQQRIRLDELRGENHANYEHNAQLVNQTDFTREQVSSERYRLSHSDDSFKSNRRNLGCNKRKRGQ
ncbi:unnamed protein product [Rotaria socialis]|uniref:RING-type domain-containing protein n=1 Tax=Rotaria socialis TaxID=392032 RepID=A0A817SNN1_9BILA|nr:unnamed protein product [Rotaria socialis]CAF3306571.1 unnamed protein product [Rotaria socialis]CAF3372919.1 unnamed protein product [Rotaria socialis]